MPALPRELQLSDAELDEMLSTEWNMRIATADPKGRINLTPLWFVWSGGAIFAFCRGQKVANMRRDPRVTVLVDRNTRYAELTGAMIDGRATVLEDEAAEQGDPDLAGARVVMARKYAGGHGEPITDDPPPLVYSAQGRSARWVRVDPVKVVSWDNAKLPKG
ncbi:MAG: pyridoxamine 5'-phosphate oxidase family protein [Acidimicrobiia bacterium]